MSDAAPYHADLAEGPARTECVWRRTSDGVRVRVARWPLAGARGTALIFPGRTEIVEKYGRTAQRLAEAGFASAAIDWRGQGLADRLLEDPLIGHVGHFSDYQRDVAAFLETIADMPRPWFLIGHSMGGCIGLRSVFEGIDVAAAAFSAPMWGIKMHPIQAPFNLAVVRVLESIGKGHLRAPTTPRRGYLLEAPFAGNTLTTDRGEWDYMRAQVAEIREFALGGPSVHWIQEALRECAWLLQQPARDLAVLTGLGSQEAIVSPAAIRQRMAAWPGGDLVEVRGAEHELLMEAPALRDQFLRPMLAHFDAVLGR